MCSWAYGLMIRVCEKPLILETYVLYTNFTQKLEEEKIKKNKIEVIKESNDSELINREQLVFGKGAIGP